MNNRPPKRSGWNTPAEAMTEKRVAIKSTVALQTFTQAEPERFRETQANPMRPSQYTGCGFILWDLPRIVQA
jgi:hypothetical protein